MNRSAHVVIGHRTGVCRVRSRPTRRAAASRSVRRRRAFVAMAAVQDDLYVKFLAPESSFELFRVSRYRW